MKGLFVPTKHNHYHAYLLRRPMLAVYLIVLIVVNIVMGGLSMTYSHAAIDISSLYQLHNTEREKRNLSDLTINPLLINSATAKAKAMLASDCWSHYCPDGESPWTFFDDAGYVYVYAGENLAEGYTTNEALMAAWMNSETHRENILNENFTEIGIGYAQGNFQGINNNMVIVVHFGSRSQNTVNTLGTTSKQENNSSVINITNPVDGSAYKTNKFDISGKAYGLTSVTISANSNVLGEASVSNGIFTYRPSDTQLVADGSYALSASGTLGNTTYVSNVVNVSIDNVAPVLLSSNFTVEKSQTGYLFNLHTDGATVVKLANLNLNFENTSTDLWQLFIEDFDPTITPTLIISAVDAAGNASSLELLSKNYVEAASTVNQTTTTTSQINLVSSVFKNQASIVNFTFLIFMSGLFGIDYLVLQKNGLTGQQRSQSHLNILLFVILAIMVILGGASGNILAGITF